MKISVAQTLVSRTELKRIVYGGNALTVLQPNEITLKTLKAVI